jgi:hypothetical protein
LAFIKWFISYLNGAYKCRVPKGQWEKKPFNPVLGEQWFMDWLDDDDDETNVVCEQVSHHPPVTGFYIENKKAGVSLNGHSGQKTRISNATLVCDQTGREVLTLKSRDETYLFTSPSLTVRGIWYAAPYVELIGTTYIQASTGYYASIEYSSRGWISGEKNHFKCLIRSNDDALARKEYLYKVEGQWSGKSTITDYKTKVSKPFLDASTLSPATAQVKPLEEMGEMETRRIWKNVSDAIRANDSVLAGKEKTVIENKKREEKKKRDEAGHVWQPQHFEWTEEDPGVKHLQDMLAKVVKQKDANEYGSWNFIKSK